MGGSKSIELIPPDTDCEVGILTGETIRLNDVVHETIGLVEIVEMIEKYVKNINQKSVQKLLVEIKSLKDDKIKDAGNEMEEIKENLPSKFKNIKQKQDEMIEKIKEVDENFEKLNQFIKK